MSQRARRVSWGVIISMSLLGGLAISGGTALAGPEGAVQAVEKTLRQLLESQVVKRALQESDLGKRIINRVRPIRDTSRISDVMYASFVDRITSSGLTDDVIRLREELTIALRKGLRSEGVTSELLLNELRGNASIAEIVAKQGPRIDVSAMGPVSKTGKTARWQDAVAKGRRAEPVGVTAEAELAAGPAGFTFDATAELRQSITAMAAEATSDVPADLNQLRMKFFARSAHTMRAYWNVGHYANEMLAALAKAKEITAEQLLFLRQLMREIKVLNPVARNRLLFQAFANEIDSSSDTFRYALLNRATEKEMIRFAEGKLGIDEIVGIRKQVAQSSVDDIEKVIAGEKDVSELGGAAAVGAEDAGRDIGQITKDLLGRIRNGLNDEPAGAGLGFNDVVWTAEKRMLEILRDCRKFATGGQIKVFHDRINDLKQQLADVDDAIRGLNAEVDSLQSQLKMAQDAFNKGLPHPSYSIAELEAKITAIVESPKYKFDLREFTQRRGSIKRMMSDEANTMVRAYLRYIENYESLNFFVNIDQGLIGSYRVLAIDMANIFKLPMEEAATLKKIFEDVYGPVVNDLVRHELGLLKDHLQGGTRRFVRELNKLTQTHLDKKFTDTLLGQEFVGFQSHLYVTIGKRLVAAGIPTTIVATAGTLAYKKLMHAMGWTDEDMPDGGINEDTVKPDQKPETSGDEPTSETEQQPDGQTKDKEDTRVVLPTASKEDAPDPLDDDSRDGETFP
ncbi:MAG: hypothetical protein AB7P04_12190 [Bacteriovoracia bacterium]